MTRSPRRAARDGRADVRAAGLSAQAGDGGLAQQLGCRLGTDFPNIPYDYATQLRAIAGWAAADDRLGVSFLHAVLRDTPARLLQLQQ